MDIIKDEYIFLNEKFDDKKKMFSFIADRALELGLIDSTKVVVKSYLQREKTDSTGFEDGFAIPHAKHLAINKPALFVIKTNSAIKWKTIDGKNIEYALALLIPETDDTNHLNMLSHIAQILMEKEFREKIKAAETETEITNIFKKYNQKNEN